MSSSPLAALQTAPIDPIISVSEAFFADPNPKKVNLGIGIYCDDSGKVPVLNCIKEAEKKFVAAGKPKYYLPMDGLGAFNRAAQHLLFGAEHAAVREKRVVTAQTLGGSGALKVGADWLRVLNPQVEVWISDPSWENHSAIFEGAGFKVNSYPYYDAASRSIRLDAMLSTLRGLPRGTIVVLHACCHNPTGLDPTPQQWQQIREAVKKAELVPFLDIAYQGFAESLDADAAEVRRFADECPLAVVASSFSKSLSLYSERVGALSLVTGSTDEAARALSHVKRVVRANYSTPPTHGGQIVATVLGSPELHALWEAELAMMRNRIKLMRALLVERLHEQVPQRDFRFILAQRGMFSYSGLTKAQVLALRDDFSIYAIDTGRICVAALNARNVEVVAAAIAKVVR